MIHAGVKRIIVSVTIVAVFLLMLGSSFFLGLKYKQGKKKKKALQELMTLEDCTETFDSENNGVRGHDLKLFSYASILASTNRFATDNKLGEGGFGPVYKNKYIDLVKKQGKLSEGHEIAVKLLSRRSEQGLVEFKTELVLMSKLQHRNLVKLLGFCIHRNDKLIIYDYVPNKSLDFFLFGGKRIIVSVTIVAVFLLILGSSFFLGLKYKQGKKKKKALQELMTLEDCTETFDFENNGVRGHDLKLFSYASILASTNCFATDNKLGEGGFGPVYRNKYIDLGKLMNYVKKQGKLSEGHEIAVKLLSRRSEQGLVEFKTELVLMSKLQHRNLVKLLGFCIHGNDKLIIYDYVPNKSLDFFLFDPAKREQLNWETRFKIIEGIAQGLLYLHKYSRITIIHRDLKASNILLDEIMNPKISDFGLARIFKHNVREANTNKRAGTYGYMAPEYIMNGVYSAKSDMYSFGVITLEIVNGQRNNSFHDLEGPMSLVQFAWELWEQGAELELMDTKLNTLSCNMKDQVRKCIQVGLLCVQSRAADRPAVEDAVSMLKNETKSLPMPGKPAFFVRDDVIQKAQKPKFNKFSMNEISLSAVDGR
ncbi:Serine/threonine protein kinase [Handroanthus impetiginosus]|uniref:non-specific serine/threonine protein kinase n=1 Tax=Handroanthus impetiginosus TaxID=429701 RepID=A0A2G9I9Y6_9LAMI|nr:Serine/threonine protein kinase [Handroanthus impetiginosus]